MRGGDAAVSTVTTAQGAVETGTDILGALRRKRPPATQMPPPPPPPGRSETEPITFTREPAPPPSDPLPRTAVNGVAPRPDGLTGTVVHGEGGLPAPVPASVPFPAFPQVTVTDRGLLRTKLAELAELYRAQQAQLAARMEALPPSERLDSSRNLLAKGAINTKEEMTAVQNQLAHPDRVLIRESVVDVVPPNGPVIPGNEVPGVGEGRRADTCVLYPDGTFKLVEYKTERSQLDAYPKHPAVTVPGFKPSSKLGDQLTRQQKIIQYAKQNGYQLRITGTPLDGGPRVSLVVSPDIYTGPVVLTYFQLEN